MTSDSGWGEQGGSLEDLAREFAEWRRTEGLDTDVSENPVVVMARRWEASGLLPKTLDTGGTMHTARYDALIAKAERIGREHGRNAAGWWEQDSIGGRATRGEKETALRVLAGIADGAPEIMDSLPAPDLSGEWADGYAPMDLCRDCGLVLTAEFAYDATEDQRAEYDEAQSVLCDAYESAFYQASQDAVAAACRALLAD